MANGLKNPEIFSELIPFFSHSSSMCQRPMIGKWTSRRVAFLLNAAAARGMYTFFSTIFFVESQRRIQVHVPPFYGRFRITHFSKCSSRQAQLLRTQSFFWARGYQNTAAMCGCYVVCISSTTPSAVSPERNAIHFLSKSVSKTFGWKLIENRTNAENTETSGRIMISVISWS